MWSSPHRAAALAVLPLAIAALLGPGAAVAEVPLAIPGGWKVQQAYKKFLGVWRDKYQPNNGSVPEVPGRLLPKALRDSRPIVIQSEGGAAGGVVTEGIGYALLVEGIQAVSGDAEALKYGLALSRAWLGMVHGGGSTVKAGGDGTEGSALKVDVWPYGVSAVEAEEPSQLGPSGVAVWKYPTSLCNGKGGCHGSAADADSDAILGMIYLAAAIEYPEDFVDMVIRAIVSFASADLGFPDLYRTLPDGTKVFVPKGGSDWGGVLPTEGKFKTSQVPWCYSPGYFAPGHYRMMRAFAVNTWKPSFDAYLPPRLAGGETKLDDLTAAFDGAVTAGYNILYYSSCESGAASNWVGVKAECEDAEALHCEGVPWATTPYVGKDGNCTASGTSFGGYGAEASRTPWRIAMDFAIYPEWATRVPIFDRHGKLDESLHFNAQVYLNRFANQYRSNAEPVSDPVHLWKAWDAQHGAPNITCAGVPYNATDNWWAALMSYPTFVGFIAPLNSLPEWQVSQWTDALVGLCDLGKMTGKFCDTSYFGASQEVISLMLLAGQVKKGGPPPPPPRSAEGVIAADALLPSASAPLLGSSPPHRASRIAAAWAAVAASLAAVVAWATLTARGRRVAGGTCSAAYLAVDGGAP